MIARLRTFLFLVLTFGLVGAQTACACSHDFEITEVSDHCHDMAMADMDHMPADMVDEDCDHAPTNAVTAARFLGDDHLAPVAAILPVQYAELVLPVPEASLRKDFELWPRPPPDIPFDRRTVFLN